MKWIHFLPILTFYSMGACAQLSQDKLVDQNIAVISQQYAPDKRVAIFNVTSGKNGQAWELTGETNLPTAKTELLDRLRNAGIDFTDNIRVLQPGRGVVNISVCNIRSEPRHSAELATQSLLGTQLRYYKEQNGWYYVQTPDGYLGWLDDGGFVPMDEKKFDSWNKMDKAFYTPAFGFVYSTPNRESEIISDLTAGNILALKQISDHWGRVRFPDNRTGYVPAGDIRRYDTWLQQELPDWSQIEKTAREFMGRPYLWGGTSGKGVDCSGFTKMVYYLHALELPRDASQQVRVGVEIKTDTTFSNLIPGDFLFFGRSATAEQPERISHVAIYLGDGKMIHASDLVQIQSLKRGDPDFVEYRLKSLVRAKRMLKNVSDNGVIRLKDHPDYKIINGSQD